MHLWSGVFGLAVGLLAGPVLASLTLTVPGDGPRRVAGWWHGAPASGRRIGVVTTSTAVLLGVVGAAIGWHATLPAYLWLAGSAVTLAVIDIEHHRLPNALTFPAYGAGLVLLGIAAAVQRNGDAYLRAVLCMAAVFVVFYVLAFLGGIGFGDTKLAGALALYLGWLGVGPLVFGLAAGFCLGALVALALLAVRAAGWKSELAFGPSLLAGAMLAVVIGRHVVHAYLGALG